jgi:hypothetical protein
MTLPSERGWGESGIVYSTGYFKDQWLAKVRACRERSRTVEEHFACMERVRKWGAKRTTALYDFARFVERVSDALGFSEPGTIAFLLADVEIELPRMSYGTGLSMGGKNPRMSVTITVNDLNIGPREVARLYGLIRSALMKPSFGYPLQLSTSKKRVRAMSARTRELMSFCNAGKAAGKRFPQLLREWNATHPEWKYESSRSLYNTYRVASARW